MLYVKFIVADEDFCARESHESARIKNIRTLFKKQNQASRFNRTIFTSSSSDIRVNSRQFAGQISFSFGWGGAALGNPRFNAVGTDKVPHNTGGIHHTFLGNDPAPAHVSVGRVESRSILPLRRTNTWPRYRRYRVTREAT